MLDDIRPLESPRRMIASSGFSEDGLVNADGLLKGWTASEDIREVSSTQFRTLTGLAPESPFVDAAETLAELPLEQFSPHWASDTRSEI
jgi:hypothetical protein